MGARNLLLAGGIYHPFEETAGALAALWAPHGLATEIVFDLEEGLRRLADESFDLLTVHCLRWSMTQHEKYAPFRRDWAFSLSDSGRRAILGHLGRGGGLLGIHTASICFDDWPGWRDQLGAAWVWGRSHHPPLGPLEVRGTGVPHPVTAGVGPFSVEDELYSELDLAADAEVLMEARLPGGEWRPAAVASEAGGSRRAYLALGHDAGSIGVPAHSKLFTRAGLWCAGLTLREDPAAGAPP